MAITIKLLLLILVLSHLRSYRDFLDDAMVMNCTYFTKCLRST